MCSEKKNFQKLNSFSLRRELETSTIVLKFLFSFFAANLVVMSNRKGPPLHSIEPLFKAHYKELCLFGLRFIQDLDTVEDVVQNVFLNIMTKDILLQSIQNPRAYLYTAVRNACLKQVKHSHQKLSPENDSDYPHKTIDSIEGAIIETETKTQIYLAVDALPDQCRKIFISCHLNQLKYHETAEELGISVNSVKTQMKKAYRLLRDALKHLYVLFVWFFLLISHSHLHW